MKRNTDPVQKKLLRQIYLNIFLLIILVVLVIYTTLSWFVNNESVDAQKSDFLVYRDGFPVYLNAQFNDDDFEKDYSNNYIDFYKVAIPGDIINLSVYVELDKDINASSFYINAHNVPDWLSFFKDSEYLVYATKTEESFDSIVITPNIDIECGAVVKNIETIPTGENNKIVFTIDIPPDYYKYGTGVCLNFSLLFKETNADQSDIIGQIFSIGFNSKLLNE